MRRGQRQGTVGRRSRRRAFLALSVPPPLPTRLRRPVLRPAPAPARFKRPVDLIIGADTVVEAGGRILEKPDDAAHAKLMLQGWAGW